MLRPSTRLRCRPHGLGRRRQVGCIGETDQDHLGRLQGHRGYTHLAKALEQHLPGARQNSHRQAVRHVAAAHPLGLGHAGALGNLGHHLDAGQPVDEVKHIFYHHRRFGAGAVLLRHQAESGSDVAFHHPVQEIKGDPPVGQAQHAAHLILAHRTVPLGDGLVEQRQAIAHRAVGGAGNEMKRRRRDRDPFGLYDGGEMGAQLFFIDAPEVKALAARQHRHRHLAHLGGGEDEGHVPGRLLKGLEKRVERMGRQHVHFVDDIDLETGRGGPVAHAVKEFPHFVDLGAAGGVNLKDIHVAVFGDGAAGLALAARINGGATVAAWADAVERPGDDACRRCLADAANAGQDESVGQPSRGEGVGKGADHGLLADQLVEGGGPVFAGEDAVGSVIGGGLGGV